PDSVGINDEGQGVRAVQCDHVAAADPQVGEPTGNAFDIAAQLLVAGFRAIGDIDDRNLVLVCRVQLAEGEFVDPNVGDLDGLPRALNWHGWSFLGAIG